MRHSIAENIRVCAAFDSGDTVTIALYDLSDESVVALDSASCNEVVSTGIYAWSTSNITTPPTAFVEYLWIMTSGDTGVTKTGKIVLAGWPEKAEDLAFTGGNVHSHTKATDNIALSAQQKLDVNAEADTALSDYDSPTDAEMDSALASAVAPLATSAELSASEAAIIAEINENQADIAAAIVSLRADIRELRRGNLLMELTAATNIDSVRKVAVGCLDYITYKTKADAASDWTSPLSTKVQYAWYLVLGSKNPYKMGEDG